MKDFTFKDKYTVYDLRDLVAALRSENGCPWDREQTHASLRRDLLEECYEVCEAIDDNDSDHLREELGDVLMNVLFHAGIEQDAGAYDIDDVADEECKKLISRHPHVFGEDAAKSAEDVLDLWEDVKMRLRGQTKVSDTMDGIAKSLPSTWRADKIISKAEKAGFLPKKDADDAEQRLIGAISALIAADDKETAVGDVLFAAVRAARAYGLDPEDTLNKANDRFIAEFRRAEETQGE